MAVTESRHEQIAEAIIAALSTIVAGTDYHYAPDRIVRTTFFTEAPFDPSLGEGVYFLRPGDEEIKEESTGSQLGEAEFFLVVARRHQVATENPYQEEAPTRWQVCNRMIRDVLKKLFSDVTLGGLAINIITDSLVIDRARYMSGWAVAELRFVVQYSFLVGSP